MLMLHHPDRVGETGWWRALRLVALVSHLSRHTPALTFITAKGFRAQPPTHMCVRLLGPSLKTGRVGGQCHHGPWAPVVEISLPGDTTQSWHTEDSMPQLGAAMLGVGGGLLLWWRSPCCCLHAHPARGVGGKGEPVGGVVAGVVLFLGPGMWREPHARERFGQPGGCNTRWPARASRPAAYN